MCAWDDAHRLCGALWRFTVLRVYNFVKYVWYTMPSDEVANHTKQLHHVAKPNRPRYTSVVKI